MRLFILVFCVSLVASRPQNSENGYQYNAGVVKNQNVQNVDRLANLGLSQKLGTSQTLLSHATNTLQQPTNIVQQKFTNDLTKSIGKVTSSLPLTTSVFNNQQQFQQNRNNVGVSNLLGSSSTTIGQQQNFVAPQQQQYAQNFNTNADGQQKNIYVHLPTINPYQHFPPPQLPPRRHYKIILVKSPQRPTPPPQPIQEVEEKTLVYVLVKKPDEPSIEELEAAAQPNFKSSKPEVYFIKYKTGQSTESDNKISPSEQTIPSSDGLNLENVNLGLKSVEASNNQQISSENAYSIPTHSANRLYDAPK